MVIFNLVTSVVRQGVGRSRQSVILIKKCRVQLGAIVHVIRTAFSAHSRSNYTPTEPYLGSVVCI